MLLTMRRVIFVCVALLALFNGRLVSGKQNANRGNTCSLYIRTDPTLWLHVKKEVQDMQDPSGVQSKTRQEILSIITHHVNALNYMFRDTKFDGRLEHRNIKFEVQRIKIDSDFDCSRVSKDPNPFCADGLSHQDLLKIHSSENHEDFCLAYLLTYRNFEDGRLGNSVLSSANHSGGICEKQKTYTRYDLVDGRPEVTRLSLNTGVITLAKNNKRLPAIQSQLNLAHYIGNSFGALEDPSECMPGGQAGNYIMSMELTNGDQPNNSKFSPCSIQSISTVLDAIASGQKRNCFTVRAGNFCGNNIVEDGEECDCGYDDIECMDNCCYPRQISAYYREKNSTAKGCTRRANTQCSPSQGPCCHAGTCQLIAAENNITCKKATTCAQASVCSGLSAECPIPAVVTNVTTCDTDNSNYMCVQGECKPVTPTTV